MQINHIAIWTSNLEISKNFYVKWFRAKANNKYSNTSKQFTSYFIEFDNSNCRIELMHSPNLLKLETSDFIGLAHFAISVGSKNEVDRITLEMEENGIAIVSKPRYTGDGYYESIILDPDGNKIEITI